MATTTEPAARATATTKSSTASMEAATASMTSAPTLRECELRRTREHT
jgi:hypothetical protein